MDRAGDGVAELDFVVGHAVAAQDGAAGLAHLLRAALEDLLAGRRDRPWPGTPESKARRSAARPWRRRRSSALAAAMAPKVYGSSTMGVKKSTVCTRASSAVSLYTPASSAVSNPISTFSSAQRGTLAKTWSNNFGLSLDAQPAAFTCAVSFLRGCAWHRPSILTIIAGMRRTSVLSAAPAAGAGAHAGLARAANRSAPEEGLPRARAQRLDPGPPGRHARRDRLPARLPAGARNPGQLQGHLHRDDARREEGLGVLPQDRAGGLLAAHRAGVPRRADRHRRRAEGARRASWTSGTSWRMNAWLELPYYDKWLDNEQAQRHRPATIAAPSWPPAAIPGTAASVIGHNNWTSYSSGERWNIIFDIVPARRPPHPHGRHARA